LQERITSLYIGFSERLASTNAGVRRDEQRYSGRVLLSVICQSGTHGGGWRMPTPKQVEKLAAEAAQKSANIANVPESPLPEEYWDAVLKDSRAGASEARVRQRRLCDIQRQVLRVSCRRCQRTVEIQTVDAVRLYGGNAIWKDVAQRLLDDINNAPAGTKKTDAGRASRYPRRRPIPAISRD
jgi:hypothetical protein